MSKEHYELFQDKGRVYLQTNHNKIDIKKNEFVVDSKDKQYIFVYTKQDQINIENMYGFLEDYYYQQKKSVYDEVLDNYLLEFGIEEKKYKNYNLVTKKVNKEEALAEFEIDKVSVRVIFNEEDAKSKGALVTYYVGMNETTRVAVTVASNRKKEEE